MLLSLSRHLRKRDVIHDLLKKNASHGYLGFHLEHVILVISAESKRFIANTVLFLVSRVTIRYCNIVCIHLGFVSLGQKRGETNEKPGKDEKDVKENGPMNM